MFKNKETYQRADQESGLVYSNITVKDLVNKDTDGDGIPDWQEGLYGLDSTKKETTPGTPDKVAINNLKNRQEISNETINRNADSAGPENTTQTAQFSRDLFTTIVAASQSGSIDQTTIDTLTTDLAEKIKNPIIRKTFLISDIKIIQDNTSQAFINYSNSFNAIYTKYPMSNNVLDILAKFIADGENVNEKALLELDPIVEQMNKIVNASSKISVPQSISTLHLNFLNTLEKVAENINDMRLFTTDPILSIGAINKYQENTDALKSAISTLNQAIKQKFNN